MKTRQSSSQDCTDHQTKQGNTLPDRNASLVLQEAELSEQHGFNCPSKEAVTLILETHGLCLTEELVQLDALADLLRLEKARRVVHCRGNAAEPLHFSAL